MVLSFHRDTDQDLDGSDPDGSSRPRSSPPLPAAADGLDPEQEPLAQMHTGENVWISSVPQWLGVSSLGLMTGGARLWVTAVRGLLFGLWLLEGSSLPLLLGP